METILPFLAFSLTLPAAHADTYGLPDVLAHFRDDLRQTCAFGHRGGVDIDANRERTATSQTVISGGERYKVYRVLCSGDPEGDGGRWAFYVMSDRDAPELAEFRDPSARSGRRTVLQGARFDPMTGVLEAQGRKATLSYQFQRGEFTPKQ